MICGIDGALTTSGIAIYDEENHYVYDVSKISTKYGTIKKATEDEKIFFICNKIIDICKKYNVDRLIQEEQFIGGFTSKTTSMQLSRLRGALTYACMYNDIKVDYINTNTITRKILEISKMKKVKGMDKKLIVAKSIQEIYKNDFIKNSHHKVLDKLGPFSDKQNKDKSSDMYDALAVATVYAYTS